MSAAAFSGATVLVTGAHGFIGSALSTALLDAGARVLAVRRPPGGRPGAPPSQLDARADLVDLDLLDLGSIVRVLAEHEVGAVFHLAAQTIVGAAQRAPAAAFEVNVRGTCHVLEACRQLETPAGGPRLVVASSYHAYGPSPGGAPLTEASDLRPRGPYDVSKACADTLAQSYAVTYGAPVAVLRPSSVYGPGDLSFSRIVPGAARALAAGERPVIRSDGRPERDMLHVDDAVSAFLAVGASLAEPGGGHHGGVWNAGSDEATSVLDLVRGLARAAGRPDLEPEVLGTPDPRAGLDRQVLDSSALRGALGWRPRWSLEDGLRDTYLWYAERAGAAAPAPAGQPA